VFMLEMAHTFTPSLLSAVTSVFTVLSLFLMVRNSAEIHEHIFSTFFF